MASKYMSKHQGMYLGLILLGPSGQTLESTHGWNEVRTSGSFETSLTVKNTRGLLLSEMASFKSSRVFDKTMLSCQACY